jgi:hypothetical protein
MDIDECFVVMNGPKVFGVFECLSDATLVISKKCDSYSSDITVKRSFNGDYLITIRGYPEFRAVKSRMY